MLATPISTGGLGTKVKVGYREHRASKKHKPLTEIEINVEWLALLAPFNEKELLTEVAADDAINHDLEKIAATKDESSDELVKDAAANDTPGRILEGLAKEASLGKPDRKGAATEDVNETGEKLKDVTIDEAARHDPREPTKETGLEDVTLHLPRRKTQRSKKKSKKAGSH